MLLDVKCTACGGDISYEPGTEQLTCQYCQHSIDIDEAEKAMVANTELALEDYLEKFESQAPKIERHVVDCNGCGATTELDAKQQASFCPFCDIPLVAKQAHSSALIKPAGLLPFKLERNSASKNFKKWVSSLWFAPSELTKKATQPEKFKGVYLPFWTYDCDTSSYYQGERGEHYYVDVDYQDSEGNNKTRRDKRTRWHSVRGSVRRNFDDVLIPAANSVPAKQLAALEPWDLSQLVDYKDEYISGYLCESYDIDLKTGYKKAKVIIDKEIRAKVKRDIGGDEQRIRSVHTSYQETTFKHLLLPVWVSAYRYKNKVYQVLVNARTGEVQGQRPYSWFKIGGVICIALVLIGAGIFFANTAGVST